MRVLILGGTTEASALAARVAADPGLQATLSLAGRTRHPAPQPIPVRIGGFGGPAGLAATLRDQRIDALVDATHPFATRISRSAAEAAQAVGVELLAILRPPWSAAPGDVWHDASTMTDAAALLGSTPRRVFLAIGQPDLAAFCAASHHHYVIRAIERPSDTPPSATLVMARGPFRFDDECALLRAHGVDILLTKNSGGAATRAKLDAARALGIPVVMVRRPAWSGGAHVPDADVAYRWLRAHATRRGE